MLFAAAFAAMVAFSCSKETAGIMDVQPGEEGKPTVLTAGFSGDGEGTRTIRQADGKVFWSANDEIAVIRGTNKAGNLFTSTNTEPQAVAEFTGTMPSGTGAIWAVHPYQSDAYHDGNYLVTVLPEKQEAVSDSFEDDLFISVAYSRSETDPLTFCHVVGGIKFSVTEPGVSKVTLTALGEEPLAGVMGIVNRNGRPTFWAWGNTCSQLELAPASGTFEVGKAYYFVTLPQTLAHGFTLLFEKEDGSVASRVVDKSVTIEAARFKTLMEADKGVPYEKDFFSYTPSAVSVSKFGGSFTVKVHASVDFHFDIACDWIKEVCHEGNPLIEATYTFKASGNTGEAREGHILVCDDKNCYFITVSQDGGSEEDWKTAAFDHHSLGMRFTATWCGYCPNMSKSFQLAKAKLGDRFQYVCFYSSTSGGYYGFSGINTLSSQYKISGFPSGIVDGRREIDNYTASYASEVIVQAVEETEANYPTASGIGIRSALDDRTLTVDVDVYTHIADSYKLTVLLLENDIVGYQRDFYVGDHDDFVHEKVARKALTSVGGTAFTTTAAQEKTSFHYTLSVPSAYNIDNLEILAYVQRPFGSQTVLQTDSYGDYYVDNCYSVPVGATWAPDLK